jgi:hypothetical protein
MFENKYSKNEHGLAKSLVGISVLSVDGKNRQQIKKKIKDFTLEMLSF